jgi:hypothetical protein
MGLPSMLWYLYHIPENPITVQDILSLFCEFSLADKIQIQSCQGVRP